MRCRRRRLLRLEEEGEETKKQEEGARLVKVDGGDVKENKPMNGRSVLLFFFRVRLGANECNPFHQLMSPSIHLIRSITRSAVQKYKLLATICSATHTSCCP